MTDDRAPDPGEDRSGDDPPHRPEGGFADWLMDLLETLAEMEREGKDTHVGRGERTSGKTRFNFDYSIRTGAFPDEAEPERPTGRDSRRRGRDARGREDASGSDDLRERGREWPAVDDRFDPAKAYLDSRVEDDEYVVIADLPGVSAERVGTELDADQLVVTVDGDPVGRVSLDEEMRVVGSSYRNNVLQLRLRLADDESGRRIGGNR